MENLTLSDTNFLIYCIMCIIDKYGTACVPLDIIETILKSTYHASNFVYHGTVFIKFKSILFRVISETTEYVILQ